MPIKMSKRGPRKGFPATHKIDKTKVNYTVVVDITNGLRILGRMRRKGQTFDAIPRQVDHWVRTGVVATTASLTTHTSTPPATPPSST